MTKHSPWKQMIWPREFRTVLPWQLCFLCSSHQQCYPKWAAEPKGWTGCLTGFSSSKWYTWLISVVCPKILLKSACICWASTNFSNFSRVSFSFPLSCVAARKAPEKKAEAPLPSWPFNHLSTIVPPKDSGSREKTIDKPLKPLSPSFGCFGGVVEGPWFQACNVETSRGSWVQLHCTVWRNNAHCFWFGDYRVHGFRSRLLYNIHHSGTSLSKLNCGWFRRRFQIQKQQESVLQGFKRKEHNTLHYPSPWFLWRSWCPVAQRSFQHLPSCSNEPSTNPRNPRSDGQPSNQRKSIGEQEGSFIIQLYKQIVMPVLASGLSESNMSRKIFHQMCCILTFQNYIPY